MEQKDRPRGAGPEGDVSAQEGDTTYSSNFAFRVNQLDEKSWKRYSGLGGAGLGLLMGIVMFAVPESVASDSVRLLIAFVIGMLPMRFFGKAAERTMKYTKIGMVVAFCSCMAAYAIYLIVNGRGLSPV